jgi:hypothetical protein
MWAPSSSNDPVERQKAAILDAAGGWRDTRSEREIVADIESHRTKGRKVAL